MNRTLFASVACLVAASVGTASASPRDALEYVEDAIDAVDEQGGKCRRAVMDDLLEIRDLLRDDLGGRAAVKIQRTRRATGRCPKSVDRALRRAGDELNSDGDRVGDRRDRYDRRRDRREYRDDLDLVRADPPPPPRAKDLPWADFSGECQAHWLGVEIARGRLGAAAHDEFINMTAVACSNPNALASATYYANGQMATTGSTWYYPNGQMARTGLTYYYPNGQMARTGNTWYYPDGQMATTGSTWYYPNGQMAGAVDAVQRWARGRAKGQQAKTFDHAMESDVGDWRTFALVRLASQTR
ncbi:MAG TPA: hypothetical protein VM513_25895 [Kofleriaceae bacterium]|nr:hypothetical protein [Kofleriaceae bacterium]